MPASPTSPWPPAGRCASRPRSSASTPTRRSAPSLADLARFRAVHVGDGDPIAFWLTTPLLGFEPPSVAVRRYWRAARALPASPLTVIAAHSGPMRALVTHALGRDLGEPDNLEAVALHVDAERADVRYRGELARIALPDPEKPTWW